MTANRFVTTETVRTGNSRPCLGNLSRTGLRDECNGMKRSAASVFNALTPLGLTQTNQPRLSFQTKSSLTSPTASPDLMPVSRQNRRTSPTRVSSSIINARTSASVSAA